MAGEWGLHAHGRDDVVKALARQLQDDGVEERSIVIVPAGGHECQYNRLFTTGICHGEGCAVKDAPAERLTLDKVEDFKKSLLRKMGMQPIDETLKKFRQGPGWINMRPGKRRF